MLGFFELNTAIDLSTVSFSNRFAQFSARSVATFRSERHLLGDEIILKSPVTRMANMLPSGKLTFCYGKSHFVLGKLTINGYFQ